MSAKKSEHWNELRLYANEIMRQLYEAGERRQLEILRMYSEQAIKMLDKEKKK